MDNAEGKTYFAYVQCKLYTVFKSAVYKKRKHMVNSENAADVVFRG